MFEQLLKLMNELYDEPASPDTWSELVYDKAIDSGMLEADATQLADAAFKIADVFAPVMIQQLETDNK